MDFSDKLVNEILDPDDVEREIRKKISKGETFDVYFARESYRQLTVDLPYEKCVPLFLVVKAFNITWERILLLYDLYLKCDIYTSKFPHEDCMLNDEEKRENIGKCIASISYSSVLYNRSRLNNDNSWIFTRVIRECFARILKSHILKCDLYEYMARAGEEQSSKAEGLPMPDKNPQVFVQNTAFAYASVQPPVPQPAPPPNESCSRTEGGSNYSLIVPSSDEALTLAGGWHAQDMNNRALHVGLLLIVGNKTHREIYECVWGKSASDVKAYDRSVQNQRDNFIKIARDRGYDVEELVKRK